MFGRRKRTDADFSEEIQAHLALETERLREQGLSEAEAAAAARRTFGNRLGAEERFYESSRWMWLDHLRQDARYAGRQFWNNKGFTAVAVLTLALGIGANTAIFSLIDAVMFRSLPVANPKQLYRLGETLQCCVIGGYQDDVSIFPYALYKQLRDGTPEFENMAALMANEFSWSVRRGGNPAPPEAIDGEFVSGDYFETLGVKPFAGRLISPGDDQPGAPPVAVISFRAWRERYGMDPSLVGSILLIDGTAFTVAGIAPPGFFGARLEPDPPDLWTPLNTELLVHGANATLRRDDESVLYLIGRLREGVPPRSVEPKLNGRMRSYIAALLGSQITPEDQRRIAQQHIRLTPAGGGIGGLRSDYQDGLRLLMAASGVLLLIACANIANLLLARSAATRVQNSVRAAIGAGRGRLLAQALTESVLLALMGGAAGLAVAFAGTRAILLLAFHGARYVPIDAMPSGPVLGFAFLASLLTGVVFGAMPAWMGSRSDPAEALRGSSRSTDRSGLPRRLLVALQMALALVLLSSAGMLTRSLLALEHQQFGFQTSGRLMVKVDPGLTRYTPERIGQVYRQIRERLAALPGVVDVSLSLYSPMEDTNWENSIAVEGRPLARPDDPDYASYDRVGPRYFETIGTPILRGRGITEQDTPTSGRAAVINETFVRKFFGNADPIGKHFGWYGAGHDQDYEVVGVVGDAKYNDPDQPPHQMFFLPLMQLSNQEWAENGMVRSNFIGDIELRVAGRPPGLEYLIRRTLAGVDPDMTVLEVRTFDDQLAVNFNRERLVSGLTLLFAMLALALASVGLYGVTAYSVVERTGEIGIRMAFGAAQSDVLVMVIRRAALQVAVGALIGLPVAFACGRVLRSRLYQVGALDPAVLAGATLLLAACALAAAFLPARRASALDPVQALRCE